MDFMFIAISLVVIGIILCIVGHQFPRFWPHLRKLFRGVWYAGIACWAVAFSISFLDFKGWI